ncbi:MAG TPA: hypothetical protein VK517_19210, partial [Cyclobacteriaceae bacterium]|nr:hypothetical protein [Cyclobacteriaceae bacterium]
LGRGSLFATGLIAGGALAGVVVALLSVNDNVFESLKKITAEPRLNDWLSATGYSLLGVVFFTVMATMLYRMAVKK